ncbi:MAG: hypothetical protein QXW47_08545 [Candidatus Jordarchaeales archaeon]
MSLRGKVAEFLRENVKLSMLMGESLDVFAKSIEEPYRNFLMGCMHELLMEYYRVVRSLISFLEEYVSLCFSVRRLFLDLLYAIGLREEAYHAVLQDDGLLGKVKVRVVDALFLRLHVKSTVNALAPSIDMTLKGFPLDELRKEAEVVESKFLSELIFKVTKQADCWDRCVEHLNFLLEKVESGSNEEVVEAVKDLLETLRPLMRSIEEALSQVTSKLGVERESEVSTTMEELSMGTKDFLEKWREAHEATLRYLKTVFFMVWSNVEDGLEKFKETIQGKKVEELIPKELSPRDVAFAASQAMMELNEAADASRMQMDKLQYFLRVTEVLESAVLRRLADEMKKKFEVFSEFQQDMFEKLEEIRALAKKEAQ